MGVGPWRLASLAVEYSAPDNDHTGFAKSTMYGLRIPVAVLYR
jgi:hypothetical protein